MEAVFGMRSPEPCQLTHVVFAQSFDDEMSGDGLNDDVVGIWVA